VAGKLPRSKKCVSAKCETCPGASCQGRNDRKPPGSRKRGPVRLRGSAWFFVLERVKPGRWESGKPAFGFPLFHPPSWPKLWECGNLACCWRDFQGARGKSGKLAFGFPCFPQPRHFHSSLVFRFSRWLPARRRGCEELLLFGVFLSLAVLQPVTLPVHLQDVDGVRQAVQQRAGQPLGAQHFSPLGKRQVAGHQR